MLPFIECNEPPFPSYVSEKDAPYPGADTYQDYGAVVVFDTDTGDQVMLCKDGSLHATGIATLTRYQLRVLATFLPEGKALASMAEDARHGVSGADYADDVMNALVTLGFDIEDERD